MLHFVIGITVAGVLLLVVSLAARRFERTQRKLGRWDQYGPLEETEPPPREGYRSRSMAERLEVVGTWKGKVLRRRLPNEEP